MRILHLLGLVVSDLPSIKIVSPSNHAPCVKQNVCVKQTS